MGRVPLRETPLAGGPAQRSITPWIEPVAWIGPVDNTMDRTGSPVRPGVEPKPGRLVRNCCLLSTGRIPCQSISRSHYHHVAAHSYILVPPTRRIPRTRDISRVAFWLPVGRAILGDRGITGVMVTTHGTVYLNTRPARIDSSFDHDLHVRTYHSADVRSRY